MSRLGYLASCAAFALIFSQTPPTSAADLRVSGAAAVGNTVIMPNKAAIEAETGLKLAVTVNGDGNGLKDLAAGKSDVMMVAAPLAVTEANINKAASGSVSAAGLEMTPIGSIAIKFIVHPSNPVRTLSEEHLKGILTGKITSWKDVGGADQQILLVAEQAGFGTRSNVVANFLGGAEITDKARVMQALAQVAQVVAQAPNAIGYGNSASISGAVAVIPGVEIQQIIGFATKGPANADAEKLINAAKKYAAGIK